MSGIPAPAQPTQLIVFADDWGRHPSSSQHLIRELLPQYPTLWVNTVGTRKPHLSLADASRAMQIMRGWMTPRSAVGTRRNTEAPIVITPRMYPGFRKPWQRWFNAHQVGCAVRRFKKLGVRTVVVSTLPTTADLIERLGADRWVYYCVDDYSKWPGTDHAVMDDMEQRLIKSTDAAVTVSEILSARVRGFGKTPIQITHGVDLKHWQNPPIDSILARDWPDDRIPIALFWGLLDARFDHDWLLALDKSQNYQVVLAGPRMDDFFPVAGAFSRLVGPLRYRDLPAHAAASNVLIMPYIDAPVTRAMQPLKLKEYLATMKPVVVRDLPSTREWADCCDLATTAEDFVRLVSERAATGTPDAQRQARQRRLADESWTAKAAQLAAVINAR